MHIAASAGLLPETVSYPLSATVSVSVPVRRASTRWDDVDVAQYENQFVATLASAAARLPRPVHLIDVGADIGLLALKLHAAVNVDAITAFEPNPSAYPYLAANLRRLSCVTEARLEAVADHPGAGRLTSPLYDADEHGRYVTLSDDGDCRVVRLDDLPLKRGSTIIKIDTEGTERDVLRGAVGTLEASSAAIVGFEAHPNVIRRTGIDPVEVIRSLPTSHRWTVIVAEFPQLALDLDRAIAPQLVGYGNVLNLVCVTANVTPGRG